MVDRLAEFVDGAPCRACSSPTRYVSMGRCVACARRHQKRFNAKVLAARFAGDKARIGELEDEVRRLRAMICIGDGTEVPLSVLPGDIAFQGLLVGDRCH